MKQQQSNYCAHCHFELEQAISWGFIHDFQIFQDGSFFYPLSQKTYDFDEVSVAYIISCTECKTCRYFIKTSDGLHGYAVEFWDNYD